MTARLGARDRILETAFRLFYANGIRGVGVNTIIAESDVAKDTLYKHFKSKDELVLAYLDRADVEWLGALRTAAQAAGPRPRDQRGGMFDALESACRQEGYHGCAFINAAAEVPPGSPVHTRTVAHKRAVRDWVHELAAQAGAGDPGALTGGLTLILDGALAAGVLDADPGVPAAAGRAAAALVDAVCPADGRSRQQW